MQTSGSRKMNATIGGFATSLWKNRFVEIVFARGSDDACPTCVDTVGQASFNFGMTVSFVQ
jgi:hypothetical protein